MKTRRLPFLLFTNNPYARPILLQTMSTNIEKGLVQISIFPGAKRTAVADETKQLSVDRELHLLRVLRQRIGWKIPSAADQSCRANAVPNTCLVCHLYGE